MLNWKEELDKILASDWPKPDPFREIVHDGIVLYGAGDMGCLALDFLKKASIKPHYIVDRKGIGTLDDISIITPEQIPERDRTKFTFVICIVTSPLQPIIDFLTGLGCSDVRHFYDCTEIISAMQMGNGWVVRYPNHEQLQGIQTVCTALEHDQRSLAHYLQFLWWRLRHKETLFHEYPVLRNQRFFNAPNIPPLHDHERFVEAGAHHGQNIASFFKAVQGKFDHIWAFEPDSDNFTVLKQSVSMYAPEAISRISLRTEAISENAGRKSFMDGLNYASRIDSNGNNNIQTVSIDSMLEIRPTIIRLHIEGQELSALHGAEKTIYKHQPILMVMADHNSDGLYKIGVFLQGLKNYRLYFYLHDYSGNSAVFYAIPSVHG